MSNDLIIANTSIRQDAHGRYCLNDLHRASGGENGKRPSIWFANEQAKSLVDELSRNSCLDFDPIVSVKGGSAPGTFAVEQLAVAYANWISPPFYLQVINTFLAYKKGLLQPTPDSYQAVIAQEHAGVELAKTRLMAAELFGVPLHISQQEAVKCVRAVTGVDYAPLLRHAPAQNEIPDADEMLEPTELAERLGIKDARTMNQVLFQLGLQTKHRGYWTPTLAGEALCARHAWAVGSKSGYNLKWRVQAIAAMLAGCAA